MYKRQPIDAAKAMWIKYEYPDITFEEMCKVFGIPKLRRKAHFCAIPSTSGTATEVTAFSIITDYNKGIKYPIADFEITPDVAIVDPDLAETMPQKLVAHTGMDAMTHAIEAYVSTANCNYTDPLAIFAIRMILVSYTHLDVYKRQVFDGAHEADIRECLREAGLREDGKSYLYDGRTGERFDKDVYKRQNQMRGEREMYVATCASCGGEAKVPFKPREDRPVYCSECFAKMKEESND